MEELDSHPDLKQSCPQKNDPFSPSLPVVYKALIDYERGGERTHLLHVGHSRCEGGLPLGQAGFWHRTVEVIIQGMIGGKDQKLFPNIFSFHALTSHV